MINFPFHGGLFFVEVFLTMPIPDRVDENVKWKIANFLFLSAKLIFKILKGANNTRYILSYPED